jgi:hypothetical protein
LAACTHVLGDRAEGQARDGHPDGPAEQGAALEPPCQGERAAQPGRRGGRPQAHRQHPSALVAPVKQRRDGHQQDQDQRHRQQQDPPPLAGERPEPLGPADGRQPRQPGQLGGRVADGAEQERRAEDREGHPVGGPRVLGHLDGDRRDAGEHQAVEAAVDDQRDRPGRREVHGDERERGDRDQDDVDHQDEQQARGQPGVPADHAGAHQLGPAGLLLLPGVPGHQEHAHQADEEDPRGDQLPGGGPAIGAGVIGRALQGHHRRVGADALGGPGQLIQVRLRRVQGDDAGGLAVGVQPQAKDPDRRHDPVAAQREPEELAGAGEPLHRRAPSGVACPFPAGVAAS